MAATDARTSATTRGTSDKQNRAWIRWKQFLRSIDLSDDDFLEDFEQHHKVTILSAFAHTVREAEYSRQKISRLGSDSVRNTVDHVAQTFRNHQRRDPRLDGDGKPSSLLLYQYKAYKSEDPPPVQQKALPGCILRQLYQHKSTERLKAIADLCTCAFFFAMRSCEYLSVGGLPRKTKRLRLRNLRFFKNRKEMAHGHQSLHKCDFISITFEDQKNAMRNDTITMHAADNNLLCPVKSWSRVVKRVLVSNKASQDSFVNSFDANGRLHLVTSNDAMRSLRAAATTIGATNLGFNPSEIGTHSLRSGSAMAMYLDEVPVYTIMLIGRWSSDAFLLYIRKQVEQFSHNVSNRMIKNLSFTHVPMRAPRVSRDDPRQRNHRDNTQTRYNMGHESTRVIPTLPSFAIHT